MGGFSESSSQEIFIGCCAARFREPHRGRHQLESACRIQVDAMRSGAKLVKPSAASIASAEACMADVRLVPRGDLEWPSLLRKLDRVLPGYEQ